MDIHNSAIESGGYLMKAKVNDLVQALPGTQPRLPLDDRTLSRKDRGVKILRLPVFNSYPQEQIMPSLIFLDFRKEF